MNKRDKIWLAAILLIGLAVRIIALRTQYFIEPESFTYYASVQQVIANHYQIPSLLPLNGMPPHPYHEKAALLYMPIVLTLFANWVFGLNISVLAIMRWLPIAFGVAGILLAYLAARKLTGSTLAANAAALAYAAMPAAINATAGGHYGGDVFTPVLVMAAFVFLMYGSGEKQRKRQITYAAATAISTVAVLALWNGGIYLLPIMVLAVIMVIAAKSVGYRAVLIIAACGLLLSLAYLAVTMHLYAPTNTLPATQSFFFAYALVSPFLVAAYLLLAQREGKETHLYFALMLPMLVVTFALAVYTPTWQDLLALPMAVFAGAGLYAVAKAIGGLQARTIVVVAAVLAYLVVAALTAWPVTQAYTYTPPFFEALQWLRNSTPPTATVFSQWSDGAAIEAVASRQVYANAWSAHDGPILNVSSFLLGQNATALSQVRPDYVVVRYLWFSPNGYKDIAADGHFDPPAFYQRTNFYTLLYHCAPVCAIDNVTFVEQFANKDTIIYKAIYT